MSQQSKSRLLLAVLAGSVFAAFYVVGAKSPALDAAARTLDSVKTVGDFKPSAPMYDTTELLMVYIGSSTCGPSNTPGLNDVVEDLKKELQTSASARGLKFATMGIARDINYESGLKHLRKYGKFDEVSSGRGWYNNALIKYLYQDLAGVAATPQVIVLQRKVIGGTDRGFGPEQLITRKVGVAEIRDWTAAHAPMAKVADARVTQ